MRSGGQTGVDLAGLRAAVALGIPAIALMPRGFRQRDAYSNDRVRSERIIREQVIEGARRLLDAYS